MTYIPVLLRKMRLASCLNNSGHSFLINVDMKRFIIHNRDEQKISDWSVFILDWMVECRTVRNIMAKIINSLFLFLNDIGASSR